jgi:hypothetical protein
VLPRLQQQAHPLDPPVLRELQVQGLEHLL